MNKRRWLLVALPILLGLIGLGVWGSQQLGRGAQQETPKTIKVQQAASKIKPATKKKHVTKQRPKPKPGQYTEAQAIKQIDALIKSHHIMGTLLLTTNGPAGVRVRTYGYADDANQVRNSANEVYPLASLQKAVTGAIIQKLINQGKLSMTTPLSQFYPNIPYANQITMRQLLDHRSGIRMAELTPKTILPTETARLNYTLQHLRSTNNHAYSYSNANFTLLAGVIRKVTHKSYQTALKNDIIRPLGLKHTYEYNDIPGNVLNPLSYRLTNGSGQGGIISKPLQSAELGCGSLYMSVGDYYKFMYGLQSGQLVGQAGLRSLADNFQYKYSAGIYYQAGQVIRVGGNDNNFHTYYMGSRNAKVALVLFENQGVFGGDNQVAYKIRDILLKTMPF
ncbi:serine hydrolase domain-containing protein [Lactiplantibacillus pentosus]|uniref:serine hydrolase domain-containing protein n=1 Tax=Lactiplantibacillus pentosus TaxID=1589 RepID=UPI000B5482A8|nr:serine hydrolase domain-containing protein [Lactiplantibacillus pentosus]ASG78875.1 D-alanyl-D-alanine carboxypeptidase [Lactiplantibacillus pentosus]